MWNFSRKHQTSGKMQYTEQSNVCTSVLRWYLITALRNLRFPTLRTSFRFRWANFCQHDFSLIFRSEEIIRNAISISYKKGLVPRLSEKRRHGKRGHYIVHANSAYNVREHLSSPKYLLVYYLYYQESYTNVNVGRRLFSEVSSINSFQRHRNFLR